MIQMMLRPKWIGALLLTIAVAAVFAGLAQWQIGRAVEEAFVEQAPTETVRELAPLAEPGVATEQSLTGSRVEVRASYVPGDTVYAQGRLRVSGTDSIGVWTIGHFVTDEGIDIPVVLGWSEDLPVATRAVTAFEDSAKSSDATVVIGRFLPSEAPTVPDAGQDVYYTSWVAVGELINRWQSVAPNGTYFGYIISESPIDGLQPIETPAPERQAQLNALNVFYAIEWVVFAGFAIYIWYRLVRDAYEREQDAAPPGAGST